jgi:hypothetical protein
MLVDRDIEPEVASGRVDETLKGIDALCARWANELWDWTVRGRNPIYLGMMEAEGAAAPSPPPGVSDVVMQLDGILAGSDERYRALVVVWYVRSDPVIIKAKRLGTNRTDLYQRWRRTLEYLKGRLNGMGVDI